MTKKHYIIIARAIRIAYGGDEYERLRTIDSTLGLRDRDSVAKAFIGELLADNPRFDSTRFIKAVNG